MLTQKQAAIVYYIIFGKDPATECANLIALDSMLDEFICENDHIQLEKLAEHKTDTVAATLQQAIWKFADKYGEIFSYLYVFTKEEARKATEKFDQLELMLTRIAEISDEHINENYTRKERTAKLATKLRFINVYQE